MVCTWSDSISCSQLTFLLCAAHPQGKKETAKALVKELGSQPDAASMALVELWQNLKPLVTGLATTMTGVKRKSDNGKPTLRPTLQPKCMHAVGGDTSLTSGTLRMPGHIAPPAKKGSAATKTEESGAPWPVLMS